jgi:hypothetical protein
MEREEEVTKCDIKEEAKEEKDTDKQKEENNINETRNLNLLPARKKSGQEMREGKKRIECVRL